MTAFISYIYNDVYYFPLQTIFHLNIDNIIFLSFFAVGLWFSSGTPVSSTNKTDCHDITDIVESGVKHNNPNSFILSFAFAGDNSLPK